MKVCLNFFLFFFISNFGFSQITTEINDLRDTYCKDSRICIFEVEIDSISKTISGKTSSLPLYNAFNENSEISKWTKNFVLLPQASTTFQKWALINVSVANLRSKPEESAELASQALLGMPIKVFEKQKGWYRVQTPDDYIGWIDGLSIDFYSKEDINNYKNKPKVIVTSAYASALSNPRNKSAQVSDLCFGDVLVIIKKFRKYSHVSFPDGRNAFIKNKNIQSLSKWIEKTPFNSNDIANYSLQMMGVPYLWGGTSMKGVDCSGFTRTSFMSAGVLLPRDASQQQFLGENIQIDNSFEKLQSGDLIFFGKKENQKATHVAIYLGNKKFIHASGMVKINSFDINDPVFDEYNLNRLLFVKRVNNKQLKQFSDIYFNINN